MSILQTPNPRLLLDMSKALQTEHVQNQIHKQWHWWQQWTTARRPGLCTWRVMEGEQTQQSQGQPKPLYLPLKGTSRPRDACFREDPCAHSTHSQGRNPGVQHVTRHSFRTNITAPRSYSTRPHLHRMKCQSSQQAPVSAPRPLWPSSAPDIQVM
jgi:hypothetical protein